jgi:hypothetical protein
VRTATYLPPADEQAPRGATTAHITGQVRNGRAWLPFSIRLGHGAGIDAKHLSYLYADGPARTIDLSEGGWAAHHALLRELLTAERPDMGLRLDEAVELVRLCAAAEVISTDEGTHPFGRPPALLLDGHPSPAALMGLYY